MFHADRIFGEKNFGGDMVEATLRTVDPSISYQSVTASRGKAVRAEPIAALYEQGKVHHVGRLDGLENEMISWQPESSWSPNRIDALVWVLTELLTGETRYGPILVSIPPEQRRSLFATPDEDWPGRGTRLFRGGGRNLW
jgi:phage terminase large subunit-like protein